MEKQLTIFPEVEQKIIHGDCLEVMRTMEDNSIDFIVTDPPYGLKFMGKQWDHGVPGKEFWIEALRICKPGAWIAAFGGTRTYHRLTCSIEDAGWIIRDCIMWLYGSGFPKGKGCLKPAWEPIILARKDGPNPALNIDECRINRAEDDVSGWSCSGSKESENFSMSGKNYKREPKLDNPGRWPSNLILDEESAQMLDEQSGPCKTGNINGSLRSENKIYSSAASTIGKPRFYQTDNPTGASRFFYCAKASPSERNGSTHPTMKPLSLMKYILKLLAPPNDPICLDPFAGSGSTLLAAKELGIRCIGIEKEGEYCEIAKSRLK